jgi:protein involved in polysaccharide export with SLBB domain
MQKFIPAILFALAVGAAPAVAVPLGQAPSVRVGPLAEEQRAEDEPEAAPAKKGERPTNGAAASPNRPRAGESRAPNGDRREPDTARNGSQPAATSSQPNNAAKPSDPPVSQPPASKNAAATDPSSQAGLATGERVSAPAPTSEPSSPAPSASQPVSPASQPASTPAPPLTSIYRIGTGDVLDIRVLNMGDARQSTLFTVLSGGVLEYPLLRDPLTVAGMTTDELSAQLVAELRHRGIYDRPQVRVSVREYASHAVLVSGLANDPGTKILRREAVPLYVVVAESQPKPEAGRAVVISHKTGQTTTIDLNDPAALNILVQAGDVVNLVTRPPAFFYIGGEIGSPGQKEFYAGMTLTQALLASGGVTRAAGPKVKVSRQGADGRLVSTEYDLPEIEKGLAPDPALQPGDRVEVARGRSK